MKLSAQFYVLILSIFFFLISFSFFLPQKTFAAPHQPNAFDFNLQKYIEFKTNNRLGTGAVNVSVEETTENTWNNYLAGMTNGIIGFGYNSPQASALPFLAQTMGSIYDHPPASGLAYVAHTLANAGLLAQPAYAQGIGFAGLVPLLPLWQGARNMSYAVLIIVMLAIGFMIIFRTKIDPKTVISVQAALPKIILTFILITFSYAIAGFMIDLMYLVMLIMIEVITKSLPANSWDWMRDTKTLQSQFVQSGLPGVWNLFISVFSPHLAISSFQQFFAGSAPNATIGTSAAVGVGQIFVTLFGGGWAGTGAGIAGATITTPWLFLGGLIAIPVILLLIIGLGLLYTFLRILFLLVNSYIQLIISIILGPLLLLKEAIPGQSAFGDWVKGLMANLVVFPATVAVIMFAWIITSVTWKSNLWGAPLTPTGGGGDIGGQGNPMAVFIGLGIIFLAPNLVASIKKAFGAKPAVPVTAGTAFSPVTGTIGTAMGAMQSFYYFQQPFLKGTLKGFADAMGIKIGKNK